ncbi:MAG: FAD-dependent oxidoreductase [Holophaga sp.]|nr:FAD-dependent oxidoreductase [Holophaga sp.]
MEDSAEILIIGGGIAGLATACNLALAGQGGVALVEREVQPGFYASGHNAGIARRLTGRAEHTALTVQGCARLLKAGLMRVTGGYLLGAEVGGTRALADEARAFGLDPTLGSGTPIPGLRAAEWLHLAGDGLIDTDGELRYCADTARAGGAQLHFGCQVQTITPEPSGFRVTTDQGTIRARILVNAAGAWAQDLGRMAGGLDIPFQPLRRHLVWSTAPCPADQPWAWWADRPLYIRPESGGALLCACEESSTPLPARGRQPDNDESMLEGLAASLKELIPAMEAAPVARLWCGLRTFSPDRRFVLGPDPIQPKLFWAAGLGGHGMTSGLAVGARVADCILGKNFADPLNPGRLLPH